MAALNILHREGFDTPMILVSGALGDVTAVECIRQGATDYVFKDSLARLPGAVRRALEETTLRQQRKEAEEAQRKSDARRKFALETAKLGDWELDLNTMKASRSLLHDQIFGAELPFAEWNFEIFLSHVHPDDRKWVGENFQACVEQGRRWDFQCRIIWPDGDIRWIWARGSQYRALTSDSNQMFGIVEDITARKRVEQEREDLLVRLKVSSADLEQRVNERTSELSATLNEREVLLQEIHHRVKNNLQVISSLMNLQLRSIKDPPTREALQEAQSRVKAISLIHEMLYQSKDYANVPFSEYARKLAANVFDVLGVAPGCVSLELAINEAALAVNKAIPCGLILNELITNALKHGFPNGRRGTVRVALGKMGEGKLQLSVTDDGVGIPAGLDIRQTKSLGMHLVHTLAEQLGAEVEIAREQGTSVRFTFAGETAVEPVLSSELV
jgi:two-component sensor histidine kinase